MASILYIVFFLSLLLLFCLFCSNNLMSPEVLFVSGFLLQAIYAIFFVYKMELDLHIDTIIVLLLGILVFVFASQIFSIIIKKLFDVNKNDNMLAEGKHQMLNIEAWLLVLFLIIEILAVVSFVNLILKVSGANSISEAMRYWDYTNKFTNVTLDKPAIVSLLGVFTSSITLIQLYLIAHQIIYHYSISRVLLFINVILGGTYTLIGGARNGIIEYSFIFVLFLYYIYKDKYYWKKRISVRLIIPIILLSGFLMLFLYVSAELMGRGKQSDLGHYIFIYLSAELKNLDTFIRRQSFGTDIAHSQTLVSLRLYLAKRYGFFGWASKLDIPFQSVNGLGLGNVYTIFYMFLYDAGLLGVVVYTIVMAALTQISMFWSLLFARKNNNKINYPLIIYGVISFATVFSFFSNKFYELIFDVGFVRKMIIMLAVCFVINHFRLFSERNKYIYSYKYKFMLFPRKVDKITTKYYNKVY